MPFRQPKEPTQTQPRAYKVTLRALLTLPFRMCNPPPAVAKVRSCGVTPLFEVRLEEVLNGEHLPPLGLKDFEEWLLFVEISPENLYFILWLREYKQRYNEWKSQWAEFQSRSTSSNYRLSWSSPQSSHLAIFYTRAKQTFFAPGSEYELNLPSNLLDPFQKAEMPPPDPAIFTEVELETYRMLEASLRRFVLAQFNNVGNRRVLCGILAGIFFSLIGSIPPLALNFIRGESRWSRLTALPGIWIGFTVLFTAMNGICLGIYIFGDLRQLRKFELSRPPISEPESCQPSSAQKMPTPDPPISPTPQVGELTPSISVQPRRSSSISSAQMSEESSQTASTNHHIQISDAYYEANDVFGQHHHLPGRQENDEPRPATNPGDPINATAGFIRPFELLVSEEEYDLEQSLPLPEHHQPIAPFEFLSLPRRPNVKVSPNNNQPIHSVTSTTPTLPTRIPRPPEPAAVGGPFGIIAHMQEECNIAQWRLQPGYLEHDTPNSSPGSPPPPYRSSPHWSAHSSHSNGIPSSSAATKRASSDSKSTTDTEAKVRKRFRMVTAVPAFAVPLTRVLSPIIVRGQWEIVVRSALLACLLAWTVMGCLLAVAPIRR